MRPFGPVGTAPWAWPDAALALVLAICFSVLILALLARHRSVAAAAGRAPVGLGLVAALAITLLVHGNPAASLLVGSLAVIVAAAAGAVLWRRPRVAPPSPSGDGGTIVSGAGRQ